MPEKPGSLALFSDPENGKVLPSGKAPHVERSDDLMQKHSQPFFPISVAGFPPKETFLRFHGVIGGTMYKEERRDPLRAELVGEYSMGFT
jgi:hypothetical protein